MRNYNPRSWMRYVIKKAINSERPTNDYMVASEEHFNEEDRRRARRLRNQLDKEEMDNNADVIINTPQQYGMLMLNFERRIK